MNVTYMIMMANHYTLV